MTSQQVESVELTRERAPGTALAAFSDGLAEAAEQAGQTVATVHGRRRLPATGIVWGSGDFVATASHVLERDADLSVGLADGRTVPATLVGRDVATDVALLRLAAPAAEGARLAPDGSARPGVFVLALGRPSPEAGGLQASFGVVSAASVTDTWRAATGGVVEGYVRADVALLPGFSGGPLVDVQGRVLGLLSAHLAGGEALAIPVASLGRVVERLRTGGTTTRAFLGISSQPVQLQASLRQRLGVPQEMALMVLGLEPGGPAEQAGLLMGDILLALGERPITDGEALLMALGPDAVGRATSARLIRAGEVRQVPITPVARP